MDSFLNFFEQMPAWQKLVWIISCLAFTWVLEGNYPLFRFDYRKWRHARINFVFLAFTITINIIFGIITVGIFNWIQQNEIGLLFYIKLSIWAELLIAVLLLDFVAQYTVHYLLHKVNWMWRVHMIHHSDTKVDVTTGTRHHPGDYILREIFALFAIIVIGAPIAFYFFYRIVTVFFAYMTHANVIVPLWLDKPLSFVFITPNVHKFHHHFELPWTDKNYGNIFSFWDRIFGTLVYGDPQKVRYGLDILDDATDENVLYQLKMPFDRKVKRGKPK